MTTALFLMSFVTLLLVIFIKGIGLGLRFRVWGAGFRGALGFNKVWGSGLGGGGLWGLKVWGSGFQGYSSEAAESIRAAVTLTIWAVRSRIGLWGVSYCSYIF